LASKEEAKLVDAACAGGAKVSASAPKTTATLALRTSPYLMVPSRTDL
jgi:hypothetical protein